jgi:hypothetical protein
MSNMSDAGFVITRPQPGAGAGGNLLSMVGALYLCEKTGRSLIVDWTENDHLLDKHANYFLALFEPLRRWRGIDIFYANDDDPTRSAHYDAAGVVRPETSQMRDALAGKISAPYLCLEAFHYHRIFDRCPEMTPSSLFHYTRQFYRALVPQGIVRSLVASRRRPFEERVVIGLNVRTGNGHPLYQAGAVYGTRFNQTIFTRSDFAARALRACRDCAARLSDELRREFAVYVVSDDERMQRRLLDEIPNAFALRTHFPPPGGWHAFADLRAVHETIADMLLLAECQGLVCNYTEFNRYAQYVTTFFNGNVRNLEHYFESPVRTLGRRVVRRFRRLRRVAVRSNSEMQ